MALAAVPPTRTYASMVSEAVRHPVAERAVALRRCDGEAEAHAKQNTEERRLKSQAKGFSRAGLQPSASTRLLQQLQVGTIGFAGAGGNQGLELSSVQGGGEHLLLGRRRVGWEGRSSSSHTRIVMGAHAGKIQHVWLGQCRARFRARGGRGNAGRGSMPSRATQT